MCQGDSVHFAKLLFSITLNGLILNCGTSVLMFIQEAAEDDMMQVVTSHLALHRRR